MSTIEKILKKIFEDAHWLQKLLIGGILSFIPIVNIFAFGYIFRLSNRLLEDEQLTLPTWSSWIGLFFDGLKFLAVFILYGILPLILAALLGELLNTITFNPLGIVMYFPINLALLFIPALIASALYQLQISKRWESLLAIKKIICSVTKNMNQSVLLATLCFIGLFTVGLPLYGLVFFLGFVIMMPYYFSVFASQKKPAKN